MPGFQGCALGLSVTEQKLGAEQKEQQRDTGGVREKEAEGKKTATERDCSQSNEH